MASVMLADDSRFMRMILRKALSVTKHEIIAEASNGAEAVKQYIEYKPDLVFMDITMPELNGIDALKQIVQINPNAKIIMCSAIGQQSAIIEALQSGAKDFVVKPFYNHRIVESVDKVLP